ncbi:hypothetical protein DDZ14_10480 [Maritimibacter sp. 55A14]|uniref:hypothetical protein n=1 Tax=Maritimibacter sp. 55A14 TaxID=2174844 RepID=UPI000D61A4C4|nr:hypothetical protein [Maritimibacter sp. 55A14]PWE32479.1 hypothetical protein DDZ14_10480 [Maritimibacter sp. 55A14]
MFFRKVLSALALLAMLTAAGCAAKTGPEGPPPATQSDISGLAQGIRGLGPEVDPEEAARAARIAYEYTHQLALEYEITDPPIVHNTKVNLGMRPRGLCKDWADDMEARLRQEDFATLDLHRAIGNAGIPLRLEHSTVVVSRRGDSVYDGLVIDPWRKGGVLHWTPIMEDEDYVWRARQEVFRQKIRQRQAQAMVSRDG